ncbi:MAG: polysaccharide biosynthesis/export family protein, partial [Planctomycetota bacterium]
MKRLLSHWILSWCRAIGLALVMVVIGAQLAGCEVHGFFDPSKTGRFEHMPTTIPILERIDVIEDAVDPWGETTSVTPEDLVPTEVAYKLSPGDLVTVQIFELYEPGRWHATSSRVDAGGFFRVPEVGDVQAGGLTAQQFEEQLIQLLDQQVLPNPLVDVIVEAATGLRYTLYGAVAAPGMYALQSPDLRLVDALAIAGGLPLDTNRVYIVRQVNLSEEVLPGFRRDQVPGPPTQAEPEEPVDIEELIRQLERGGGETGGGGTPPQPGVLSTQDQPTVDVDDLRPQPERPQADRPGIVQPPERREDEPTFIFDPVRGEWIPVRRQPAGPGAGPPGETIASALVAERVIEIPFQQLKRGDSSQNVIIRPGDRVYVQEAAQGVVYLEGEVFRGGVYALPPSGFLTLSRLIAAAGGLGPLAIPERVDLTRVVGHNREATVRLNLAAIRTRTEPDVVLRPNDHVIVGTNFWATPL